MAEGIEERANGEAELRAEGAETARVEVEAALESGDRAEGGEGEAGEAAAEGADELASAKAKCADMLDQILRAKAEFANYKQKTQNARFEGRMDGIREAITPLLPTVDNLERAIGAGGGEGDGSILEGVRLTYRLTMEALAKLGLEEIPALGEPFDPDMHEAVLRGEGEPPGTVLEVLQKGYRVGGKVIRYAMVKVAAED